MGSTRLIDRVRGAQGRFKAAGGARADSPEFIKVKTSWDEILSLWTLKRLAIHHARSWLQNFVRPSRSVSKIEIFRSTELNESVLLKTFWIIFSVSVP